MIYSLHDAVNGGFRYFEAPGSVPINDDHPVPSFSVETRLGVPSVYAGRPIPARSTPVGAGPKAKGIIVSPSARQPVAVQSGLPSGIGGLSGTFDGVCPHWQRENSKGECVNKWWAGPPLEWLGSGLGYALGGALVGAVAYLVWKSED